MHSAPKQIRDTELAYKRWQTNVERLGPSECFEEPRIILGKTKAIWMRGCIPSFAHKKPCFIHDPDQVTSSSPVEQMTVWPVSMNKPGEACVVVTHTKNPDQLRWFGSIYMDSWNAWKAPSYVTLYELIIGLHNHLVLWILGNKFCFTTFKSHITCYRKVFRGIWGSVNNQWLFIKSVVY